MPIDRLSFSTVPVTALFNDRVLPEATAFIWKRREKYYLITNWHVVSAVNLFTRKLILEGGSRPNKLRCHFVARLGQDGRELIEIPIRDDDDQPLWLVHPAQEMRPVDVVALPIGEAVKEKVTLLPVNNSRRAK